MRREKVGCIICACGFVLMSGTAAASDAGKLSFHGLLLLQLISLFLVLIGAYLGDIFHEK